MEILIAIFWYILVFLTVGFIASCAVFWWLMMPHGSVLRSSLELSTIIGYYLLHVILVRFQRVWWAVTGVQRQMDMAQLDKGYDSCVQVRRVIGRMRFPKVNHPRPWDFTSLHETFTHPRRLLSEHVTLYCVDTKFAYFVQTPGDIDVCSSKTSPFMKRAQFEHAVKVLIMPLRHFHKLAKSLGDPSIPVAWINNTGRCGSTLVIQMLERVPRMRCLSEPGVMTNVTLLFRTGEIDSKQLEDLTCSCVRYLCREAPRVSRMAVKVRYTSATDIGMMQKLFPDFQHLYLYRDLGNVMTSFYKFMHRDLAVCMMENILNNPSFRLIQPKIKSFLVSLVAFDDELFESENLLRSLKRSSFMGYSTAVICSNLAVFKKKLENGDISNVPTLHYDYLVRNPWTVSCRLFEHFSIPTTHIQDALQALDKDSQAGDIASNIGINSTRIVSTKELTIRDIDSMNSVLEAMGLPDMSERLILSAAINRDGE